ncbi:hypothetical protein, partial [Sebaldella sp. S0638]|uniref:hypothetical protein n=1 Tax=Sebaldella sp. S0638 TaxID=2957809 RepID=UPI0020A1064B
MWKDKKVIRKAKVITIPTNTAFKLSDYTQGIAWGEHILKTGIVNMEHGYDTYSVEVQNVRTGHDTYYTRILKKRVQLNNTPNNYHIPYNQFGQVHTLLNESNLAGVTIHITVKNCVPPLQVLVLLNTQYWVINQTSNNASFLITGTLKIPPSSSSLLEVQLIPTSGQVMTTTTADISFYRFYGVEEEINGTTNVIAYEV